MGGMGDVSMFLSRLAGSTPLLVACVVGIVWAVIWRERSPKAATLVLVGCIGLAGTSLLSAVFWTILIRRMMETHDAVVSLLLSSASIGFGILHAVFILLIAYAAFADRRREPMPWEIDQPPLPKA